MRIGHGEGRTGGFVEVWTKGSALLGRDGCQKDGLLGMFHDCRMTSEAFWTHYSEQNIDYRRIY